MVYLPHWPIPASFGNKKIDYEAVFLRMSQVLSRLDNPHLKLPSVIHVTGTNGKGSVMAFLAAILKAKGLRVHLYTSPHLHNCNERIMLDLEKISDNSLYEVMEETRLASHGVDLTFFEAFTIGAFLAFSKVPADVLIVEVGMGARIDATNIIEQKLATIITPISFDHVEYLGDNIAKIAFEKAHIIRPNTPLILAPQPRQALEIIELIANDQNAKIIAYDKDFSIILDEENNSFDFEYLNQEYSNLPAPCLSGDHQYINASTAIATALTLPFNINKDHIIKGLQTANWSSRIEKISLNFNKFYRNDWQKEHSEIFIDGAHNQGGAFALAKWLDKQKIIDEEKNFKRQNFIICGFTKNKCKKEFLENFVNVVDKAVAIRVEGEPNPEDASKIKEIGQMVGLNIESATDLAEAIYYICNNCDDAVRIVICGSLHLARDAKNLQ